MTINMNIDSKKVRIIQATNEILNKYKHMTVRAVFYQLVGKGMVKNSIQEYNNVGRTLTQARREGLIDWQRITDHTTKYYGLDNWETLKDFMEDVKAAFRLTPDYDNHIEVWVEKDAMSWISEITQRYNIPTVCTIGYAKYTALQRVKERIADKEAVYILILTDYDPSGENIVEKVREEIGNNNVYIRKIALTEDQVKKYNLPSVPAKTSDPRTARGSIDVQVEMDALDREIMEKIIVDSIHDIVTPEDVKKLKDREDELREAIA